MMFLLQRFTAEVTVITKMYLLLVWEIKRCDNYKIKHKNVMQSYFKSIRVLASIF